MSAPLSKTPSIYDKPCIVAELGRDDSRCFTVESYAEIQGMRYHQPIWARRVPAPEELSEPAPAQPYSVRNIDREACTAQMLQSCGLA